MTTRDDAQNRLLLFVGAAIVRFGLALAFPDLPDFLSGRVEIATPVTGFKRLQEGVFLYNHGVSPYDGGVFHQVPLLLSFFSLIPDLGRSKLTTIAIYTILDLLTAKALVEIASSDAAVETASFKSPRRDRKWSPEIVAACYLFNPFTILTCLGRPTSVFATYFVVLATAKACDGAATSSAFALALASYTSLHPGLLVPAMATFCHDRVLRKDSKKARSGTAVFAQYTIAFAAFFSVLLSLSFFLVQDWSFLHSVYGTRLLLPDLTPNVGLWWYFFIEMFDSFRSFFLGVFWIHMASYAPVLTLRLKNQPLAAIVLLCGVFTIFQPYAN
ncbi:GPI transamidase subunit PIG-U-like protein [Elsinoe fawcettii]|nr:GPI transamidase subunit PIG-U-like protein [Elsinoe fawcettii]